MKNSARMKPVMPVNMTNLMREISSMSTTVENATMAKIICTHPAKVGTLGAGGRP